MTKSSKHKYAVSTSTTKHVTITIDRSQLWLNFIEFWGQYVLYNSAASLTFSNHTLLREIYSVLINDSPLVYENIVDLFKRGYTCFLMDNAMEELDKKNVLRTIIVKDRNGEDIIVNHKDIVF